MKRTDILDECPEEFKASLKDFIDEVEGEVNAAKRYLTGIASCSDLGNVQDCLSTLEKLSDDLY